MCPSERVGEDLCPSLSSQADQTLPSSSIWLYSVPPWIGRGLPTLGGPSALFSLLIQILISSRNTLKMHPEIMLNRIAGHLTTGSS